MNEPTPISEEYSETNHIDSTIITNQNDADNGKENIIGTKSIF